ncbi:receptor-like kinase TMK3 [Euphorbia lathyris]|uniref:receptor-like kinase TMK3 n=1 Tax=Euphorbia lathyris TaxID=212925 RepID=UPI003313E6F1
MQLHRSTSMIKLLPLTLLYVLTLVWSETNPSDFAILKAFRDGLENPELLDWPSSSDDPCGELWKHVHCVKSRVTQIQVQNMNLKGPLPPNLNQLTMLENLGFQRNQFNGVLPSFKGLSRLQYAYLDYNLFNSIPFDFFDGLTSLQVLALDNNPFNASTGWRFPQSLQDSSQLTNLSCVSCNLVGSLPDFLGEFSSLQNLKLSGNNLSGEIPGSFKGGMSLQNLWLNNQNGGGLNGSIDLVSTMESLSVLWLHGNQFTGKIPENISNLTLLKDLNLNGNKLVGFVPQNLANMALQHLDLNNNQFMGPIPKFKAVKVTCDSNPFCSSTIGGFCAPEVMALLGFLDGLNFPPKLSSSWIGNDPCSSWIGVTCESNRVYSIALPNYNLTGNLSPSIAKLESLHQIKFGGNYLSGSVPSNWTNLASLKLLDLSDNNISPPFPRFSPAVKVIISGNPLLTGGKSKSAPSPPSSDDNASSGTTPNAPENPSSDSQNIGVTSSEQKSPKRFTLVAIVAPIASIAVVALLIIPLSVYYCKKKKEVVQAPSSVVIHPRDPSDSDTTVKVVVANPGSVTGTASGSGSASRNSSGIGESHVIEAGNLVISVQVLRNVTNNFAPENELGRGGFGVVYKGELDDGTKIAVKRMEAGVISSKAVDEFEAEIAVLSKVRHRHLVTLLGYSIGGNERILVYEYMPQGALSRHLFHWKKFNLEPLSLKRRLNIALDVARGMDYLHNLAHRSFIHRDLKSSNILLGDDFRAKISDFGLVKLAPDGDKKSVVTRLAGTFGYLAPEYAVTGKITTKVDVFSFGVVLMEILTGMMALDEDRPEESQYLASWFWHIKSDKLKLRAAIDPSLDAKDETFDSIFTIAELAGHCTAREPNQRPDMSHAVNVLGPLVEKWKPLNDETDEYCGIDYSLPLNQMVKGWQEAEGKDFSYADLEDSKGSIPARPAGFAESFTSVDGR